MGMVADGFKDFVVADDTRDTHYIPLPNEGRGGMLWYVAAGLTASLTRPRSVHVDVALEDAVTGTGAAVASRKMDSGRLDYPVAKEWPYAKDARIAVRIRNDSGAAVTVRVHFWAEAR